jgi:hypothetical protein
MVALHLVGRPFKSSRTLNAYCERFRAQTPPQLLGARQALTKPRYLLATSLPSTM